MNLTQSSSKKLRRGLSSSRKSEQTQMGEEGLKTEQEVCAIALRHGYEIQKSIGKGAFGKIYSSRCLKTNQNVAIKVLQGFGGHNYTLLKVIREISILSSLSSIQNNFKATLVTPLLNCFAPENELESGEVKTLFVVMRAYEMSLYELI